MPTPFSTARNKAVMLLTVIAASRGFFGSRPAVGSELMLLRKLEPSPV
jgi:hypothetical protein